MSEISLKENIETFLRHHAGVLAKTDRFLEAITRLRYEGKVAFGKNMNEVGDLLDYFTEKIIPHMKVEDIIFSFLEIHIPKLEALIRLLQAEHKELKVNLEVLRYLFDELSEEKSEPKRTQLIEQLKDKATYFSYFVRNHVQAEEESIYRSIDQELHLEEKKELIRRIKECEAWEALSQKA